MSQSSALRVERPQPIPQPSARPFPATRAVRLPNTVVRGDVSCVFGLVLTALTFASILPETDPGHGFVAYWVAGTAGVLSVLGSLLVHELGHVLAARRTGLGVVRI